MHGRGKEIEGSFGTRLGAEVTSGTYSALGRVVVLRCSGPGYDGWWVAGGANGDVITRLGNWWVGVGRREGKRSSVRWQVPSRTSVRPPPQQPDDGGEDAVVRDRCESTERMENPPLCTLNYETYPNLVPVQN